MVGSEETATVRRMVRIGRLPGRRAFAGKADFVADALVLDDTRADYFLPPRVEDVADLDLSEESDDAAGRFNLVDWRGPVALFLPLGFLVGAWLPAVLEFLVIHHQSVLPGLSGAPSLAELTNRPAMAAVFSLPDLVLRGLPSAVALGVTLWLLSGRQKTTANIVGLLYCVTHTLLLLAMLLVAAVTLIGGNGALAGDLVATMGVPRPLAGAGEPAQQLLNLYGYQFAVNLIVPFISALGLRYAGLQHL